MNPETIRASTVGAEFVVEEFETSVERLTVVLRSIVRSRWAEITDDDRLGTGAVE